jgi:hypothetical protein
MSAPRWEWKLPHDGDCSAQPQLHLFNSYQNRVVPFVPAAGQNSRQISWYTCGPTVYEVGRALPTVSTGGDCRFLEVVRALHFQ